MESILKVESLYSDSRSLFMGEFNADKIVFKVERQSALFY
jgi:hypothetical protein